MSYKSRVLSIDGGGIRGIIPAMILAEIENRMGKPICELFNLIAGTSTGGILTCGLTKPHPDQPGQPHYSAEKLVDMYREEGEKIFHESQLGRHLSVDKLLRPKFASKGRDQVLTEYLAATPLKEALTEIFITSYDIELRAPVFFVNNSKKEQTRSKVYRKVCNGFTMKQASMATSAAPTYFEPYKLDTGHLTDNGHYALVDGGVFANNPASLALMETFIDYKREGHGIRMEDVLLVSLGTGSLIRKFPYTEAKNWGAVKWILPIISITLDGTSESVAVQLEQLMPKAQDIPSQYYRFQAFLNTANDDMDDASPANIANLEALAKQIIAETDQELDELCQQLSEPLAILS